MGHYFENDKNLVSNIQTINVDILDHHFIFYTDNGVFSKKGLDFGTRLLINNVLKRNLSGSILDLGCGYGPIGIILKKERNADVIMSDVNRRALHLAKRNAKANGVLVELKESNGYENIDSIFDYIVSNPPIRIGKEKLYQLIIDSKKHLKKGGEIFLVIRKEQGALSFINDMGIYYDVEVIDKEKGFFIISLKND